MDNVTKEIRSKTMSAIKSKRTKLEDKISKKLWNHGYRFRRNDKSLYGNPDISIKKYKVVIFIDSCFWHGCEYDCRIPKSNVDYWINKIERNKERDRQVTEYYKKKRWFILRIWEHQIKKDIDGTIKSVITHIEKAKKWSNY